MGGLDSQHQYGGGPRDGREEEEENKSVRNQIASNAILAARRPPVEGAQTRGMSGTGTQVETPQEFLLWSMED